MIVAGPRQRCPSDARCHWYAPRGPATLDSSVRQPLQWQGREVSIVQWTIQPQVPTAFEAQVLDALERGAPVRRWSRHLFLVPSWTQEHVDHRVVLTFAREGWRATCTCPARGPCKHGYLAAHVAAAEDGTRPPTPRRTVPRRPPRARARGRADQPRSA